APMSSARPAPTLSSTAPPPQARRPQDAATQRPELHDLTVVDEQVHLGPIVLDVPGEHLRVGRLPPASNAGGEGGATKLVDMGTHHRDGPRIQCADRAAEGVEHVGLERLSCSL